MVTSVAPAARAYPFLSPRPVPSAIGGPTDPNVAAVFYNPAALGALHGFHVWIDGGARADEGSIDRAPLEGQARGSTPINWASPDAFAGLSWDFNTDSFVVGVAVYTPFTETSTYGPDSPVRFHEADQTFIVLEESVAAAYKFSGRFYAGLAANFAQSWMSWRFSRDAALAGGSPGVDRPGGLCGQVACGLENPLAEQRLRLRGFGWGLGFSVGVLGRPVDRLWLAASYTSHVFNTGSVEDFPMFDNSRGLVAAAPGQGGVACSYQGAPNVCSGNNFITAAIPDIIQIGARFEVTPRFELESSARWVHYGIRSNLDVSLQGGNFANLGASQPPAQQLYDRGLQDAWGVEASGRWRVGEKLRLAPSIFFETSAIDKSAVNAAAVDGPKLDFALTAEWRPLKHLSFGAHVGATAVIIGDVQSRFNPRAVTACVDAQYHLDACSAVNSGQGLPSASGSYSLFVVHASGAIGIDY